MAGIESLVGAGEGVEGVTGVEGLVDEATLCAWGVEVGRIAVRHGVFVALYGGLGAGKTRLTQAACEGAGVKVAVTSPTYTMVHIYEGDAGQIAHVDLYRIAGVAELPALGWEELEGGDGPVFVEWAARAQGELRPDRWDIWLEIVDDGSLRRLRGSATGSVPPLPELPPYLP